VRAPRPALRDQAGDAIAVALVPLAAGEHRGQHHVRELGPRGEHRPERRPLERDDLSRLLGHALRDRRLAGERRDVAEERAGVGLRDPDVLAGLAVEQPHAAALDHQERRVAPALLIERLAGGERSELAELRELGELRLGQPRVQPLVVEVRETLGAELLRGGFERHARSVTGSPSPML